ncbi:MAG: hypothetical protein ABI551_10815 [Polyangiaceae bacterium]
MATTHDTDPNAMLNDSGTDPNYPAGFGSRPSYGKLNYGPQMRAETDPDFLTPPSGSARAGASRSEADAAPDSEPVSSGPESQGALVAQHQTRARAPKAGNNDTVPMIEPVVLNETIPLPDAMVAPEIVARRHRPMRRDQKTELNAHGRQKVESKLTSAILIGIVVAGLFIVFSELFFR